MDWKTDWGLRARMALTMFLLVALYVGFIGVLLLTDASTVLIVGVMSLFLAGQFLFSDRLALYSMGASRVDEQESPELHATVQRLSQQADIPKPDVAVADTRAPNAFATGRSRTNAVVCVTRGLLETLDRDELEGVIAHELAHVKHRDVAVMTIASFLSTVALIVVRWGWLFVGDRRDQGALPAIAAILVSLLVWIISYVLIRALSRYREYAADRGAAIITGQPSALASALMKINERMDRVPEEDLRDQAEMNAFFIVPVSKGFIATLARTHPPTEKRVDRLQALEREMETA
jgi:heat shock protein HtpX